MALFGFPFTVPFGGHEEMFRFMEVADIGDGPRARFEPLDAGYNQYCRMVVDGLAQGRPRYARYGARNEMTGLWESPDTKHQTSICPQGDWATDLIDVSPQYVFFQAGVVDRLSAEITVSPQLYSYGESGQLTSWSLTGLKRFANVKPVPYRPLWGQLAVTIANSGGTYTVTLKLDNITIASGSRVGNGSVTLSASNSSGVSGSVTITFTGEVTSGAYLVARWPASIKMHHRITTPFAAPDFPRTAEGTLYDDGRQNVYKYRSGILAAGTYYVVPHQVDEGGNESTGIAGGGSTVVLVTPPEAAGTPVYASGGAAATTINFAASATPGSTYNIYDSNITDLLDVETVTATHIAGSGTLSEVLPALTDLNFTGVRLVLVRAVSSPGGIEEKSLKILKIEYDAGVVVQPRPPAPGVGQGVSTSGRTLTIPFAIDTAEQLAAAASIELFLAAIPSGGGAPTFNYASPDATLAAPAAVGTIIQGTISVTAGANVDRYYALRTKTAGGVQSDNTEYYGPVRLTTADFIDPASFTVREGF